jgi:hypothetical protein
MGMLFELEFQLLFVILLELLIFKLKQLFVVLLLQLLLFKLE